MIKLLLPLTALILTLIGYYFAKHRVNLSHVLGEEENQLSIQQLFLALSKTYYGLALLGLVLFFFPTKTIALGYISVIMIASAFFSLKLSKKIS